MFVESSFLRELMTWLTERPTDGLAQFPFLHPVPSPFLVFSVLFLICLLPLCLYPFPASTLAMQITLVLFAQFLRYLSLNSATKQMENHGIFAVLKACSYLL